MHTGGRTCRGHLAGQAVAGGPGRQRAPGQGTAGRRPRGAPAAAGGAVHQQEPGLPGGLHPRPGQPRPPRPLPQLQAHLPAAGARPPGTTASCSARRRPCDRQHVTQRTH